MDLTLISKYRTQLMGFSILIIVFYHFFGIGGSSFIDIAFRKLFSQGYVGVDFFMFSSGLGLVYSISKTENLKDCISMYGKNTTGRFRKDMIFTISMGTWKTMI